MESRKPTRWESSSLRSDTQLAHAFYKRCGAEPMYDHCHRVSSLQMRVGITEPQVLLDPKASPERKHANKVLHNGALLHTMNPARISSIRIPLPPALDDPDVRELIEKIWVLTTLDRAGAPNSHYASLLNGGSRPSLALLVKLADYAVTHTTEEMLNGLIDPEHASMFRTYDSTAHALECMRNEASAGERIYAPIAELFGYPQLAGTIMGHAYQINHPEIHASVMCAMADDVFQARILMTQKIVREIAAHIKAELKRYGFDADVTMRPVKSKGKIMRKVYRMLKGDLQKETARTERDILTARLRGEALPQQVPQATDAMVKKYIRSKIGSFDFSRLSDWVAARVVVNSYKGRKIYHDDLPFSLANSVVEHAISMQRLIVGDLEHGVEMHRGRYNAVHHDVSVSKSKIDEPDSPLNFEIQLKTKEWHDIAEHGKAAHYYYLGGDREFMDTIAAAYHDIIHEKRNGNGRH